MTTAHIHARPGTATKNLQSVAPEVEHQQGQHSNCIYEDPFRNTTQEIAKCNILPTVYVHHWLNLMESQVCIISLNTATINEDSLNGRGL